jgi:oxygen-independent coproporphyrinogen-3 oxidase
LIDGRLPITDEESLTLRQRRREALIFGLRLIDGIPFDRAAGNDEDLQKTIARLTREGLLESTGGRVKLTEVGRRHADTVAVALL